MKYKGILYLLAYIMANQEEIATKTTKLSAMRCVLTVSRFSGFPLLKGARCRGTAMISAAEIYALIVLTIMSL